MIDYKELKRKVKSMSAHDIIMSMVNGLRGPKTKVDMGTFGAIRNGICFGCAATNVILRIMDANEEEVRSHVAYRQKYDNSLLRYFEFAINALRHGGVEDYNEFAMPLGIAQITPIPGQELPRLNNDFTEEQLQEYVKLAEYQLTVKKPTIMNYAEFETKVKSMSAHDIIISMVNGLRDPKTKIDMQTFGEMRDGVCFGCAATNAVLHIMDANEEGAKSHVAYTEYDGSPVRGFERAINNLRKGEVDIYNEWAKAHGFAQITPMPGQELPCLGNDYTEDELQEYVKLAEYNKIKEA